MTILQRLATPKPFVRLTRGDYERLLDRLYEDRDRAEGALRADRDRVAALIEQAADAHARDAEHLDRLNGHVRGSAIENLTAGGHRAVEHALRDIAREIGDVRP